MHELERHEQERRRAEYYPPRFTIWYLLLVKRRVAVHWVQSISVSIISVVVVSCSSPAQPTGGVSPDFIVATGRISALSEPPIWSRDHAQTTSMRRR